MESGTFEVGDWNHLRPPVSKHILIRHLNRFINLGIDRLLATRCTDFLADVDDTIEEINAPKNQITVSFQRTQNFFESIHEPCTLLEVDCCHTQGIELSFPANAIF